MYSLSKISFSILFLLIVASGVQAQSNVTFKDSIYVKVYPKYDSVSNAHRKFFGENYRREYALDTKLPIIRISQFNGGLKTVQQGGGNQTKSVRLSDGAGKEWVLRKVEKYPEILLPEEFRETFFKDLIKDNMSSQHPFSALVVPTLARAAGLPHTDPVIGWVAADENLGPFNRDFANTVCLLEEREPVGKSDNTEKAFKKISENNNYSIDSRMYLKLKCLDVLIGDWDRHVDQWRWKLEKDGKDNTYYPVPKDRDQVFFRSDGKVQRFTQSSWFLPMMQGYERDIKDINWFMWEGREINSRIFSEMDEQQWDETVSDFCSKMTDEVLDRSVAFLPEPGYSIRGSEILEQLKRRRDKLPDMMKTYYHFFNRIIDIELSDKEEIVHISDGPSHGLNIEVYKIKSDGRRGEQIYKREIRPDVTKEVRIYLHSGADRVKMNAQQSRIKIRLIGGKGDKSYDFQEAKSRVILYEHQPFSMMEHTGEFTGRQVIKPDSANTAYVAKDMYSRHLILPYLAYNNDDGIALGLALKFISPGFRKAPYGTSQTISARYSFSTSAFKIGYGGEWLKALGNADLLLQATANAPNNTQNFFGMGNQTDYDDTKGITYYRARFSVFELDPLLRWRFMKSKLTVGPSLQYYTFDAADNQGRFINNVHLLKSSDSLTLSADKFFVGLNAGYTFDSRNNSILPSKGFLAEVSLLAYKGLNELSNNFGQLNGSLSFFQKLNKDAAWVITDKIGGGLTVGDPAFYQSQFLGGQGNLVGYRQFRFAGKQVLYNNFALRVRLGNILGYILPGELGMTGLYDVGRVWVSGDNSKNWHHGTGAGFYFSPASLYTFQLIAGYSKEGWYPSFSMRIKY